MDLKGSDEDVATVTFIKESKQTAGAMKGVIDYVCREKKTKLDENTRLISGKDCIGQLAFKEFMATKAQYDKVNGVFFYQYVQSFSPEEKITPKQAHQLGLELAKYWQGYEVLVATHIDANHIHNHLIINSVSFENGKKLHQAPKTLQRVRKVSDDICIKSGFSVLKPYNNTSISNYDTREYRAAVKGKSWKFALMSAINKSMKLSVSKSQFIQNMKAYGYFVRWTENKKNITFTCPNGMKCRDNKLHDKKYLKEMMENEFKIREQIFNNGRFIENKQPTIGNITKTVLTAGNSNRRGTMGSNDTDVKFNSIISTENDRENRVACEQDGNAGIYRGNTIDTRNNFRDYSKEYNGTEQQLNRVHNERDSQNEGICETGWERERQFFRETFMQATRISEGAFLEKTGIFKDNGPVVHKVLDSINSGINIASDVCNIIKPVIQIDKTKRCIRDCTTIKQRKKFKRRKKQDIDYSFNMHFDN